MTIKEQFLAALACSAVADAIGDEFEFQHNIKQSAVLSSIQSDDRVNVTDDSQMTYFGMRALRTKLLNPSYDFECIIKEEYLNWYATQVGCSQRSITGDPVPQEFFKRRAPGTACMTSLRQLATTNKRPTNTSRGCGSVMRILPFASGIVPYETGLDYALISAGITHDHYENTLAVKQYVDFAYASVHCNQLSQLRVTHKRVRNAERISQLGAGFYATEAVNMAMWAVNNSFDFEDLLLNSICHNGDSDSVGAIAGGLWGLTHKEMPPKRLLSRVAEWPAIETEARALLKASGN